jgi:hypothetical protein
MPLPGRTQPGVPRAHACVEPRMATAAHATPDWTPVTPTRRSSSDRSASPSPRPCSASSSTMAYSVGASRCGPTSPTSDQSRPADRQVDRSARADPRKDLGRVRPPTGNRGSRMLALPCFSVMARRRVGRHASRGQSWWMGVRDVVPKEMATAIDLSLTRHGPRSTRRSGDVRSCSAGRRGQHPVGGDRPPRPGQAPLPPDTRSRVLDPRTVRNAAIAGLTGLPHP